MPAYGRTSLVNLTPATSRTFAVLAAMLLAVDLASAQGTPPSPASDAARVLEILGTPTTRSQSASLGLSLIRPDVRTVWNSALPFSLNDGSLWAGRGANVEVSAGVQHVAKFGSFRVELAAAPTIDYSQNKPFPFFTGADPTRSTFSSPWHIGTRSADLPLRFGNQRLLSVGPGRSRLAVARGDVSIGLTSEEAWWGPALRNSLVLSNNAGGVPRAFVRVVTSRWPRIGSIDAQLIAGRLTESLYFDTLTTNDLRALSGLRIEWSVGASRALRLGFARAVYSSIARRGNIADHALDAVTNWTRAEGDCTACADQITSFFGRWIFPEAGLEIYGEWGRTLLPRRLSEFLTDPHETQGFTVGGQWVVRTNTRGQLVRLQAEATNLEQSAIFGRVPGDFYTGARAPQGYTHRGQIVGAAIGPGSSSQFIGGDLLRANWRAGLFVGRIRWEDDAMFRQRIPSYFHHDVSIFSGIRGGVGTRRTDIDAELSVQRRLNYLFQNGIFNPGGRGTVRIQNVTVALRFSPK
jgi:hypothetical protein